MLWLNPLMKSNKLATLVWAKPQYFHSTPVMCKKKKVKRPLVYGDGWVDSNIDPEYYKENKPVEGDNMYSVPIRPAPTDHTYSIFFDPIMYKLEKKIMRRGDGMIAQKIVNEALENIKVYQLRKYHLAPDNEKDEIEINPVKFAKDAIENCKPLFALRTMKKGGVVYRVPFPLSENKRQVIALKWIYEAISPLRQKSKKSLRLSNQLLAAYNNTGDVVKRKETVHKEAEAHRAYAFI